jgi:hypothetical protein
MPVEVAGQVEWLVNRTADGWLVSLLNPAGQIKPQQGITPTDYRQNKVVRIRSQLPIQSAIDRLEPTLSLTSQEGQVVVEVPAGGVRIIELK